MKLSSIDTSAAPKHILVYGPPKSGKTEFVMQLADPYNLNFLDLENGFKTGKKLSINKQDHINVVSIADTKNNPVAMQVLTNLFKSGKLNMCVKHSLNGCQVCTKTSALFEQLVLGDFTDKDVLVIDSLTQLSNSIMSHIGRNEKDDWTPEWKHFRMQGVVLDMILSEIQNAPYHVICITHETSSEMEDGKEKLVPVAGTRNFSRSTAKYFDTVIYCEVKNGRHIFASKTTYGNNILTGDRLGVDVEATPETGLLAVFTGDRSNNKQIPAKSK